VDPADISTHSRSLPIVEVTVDFFVSFAMQPLSLQL